MCRLAEDRYEVTRADDISDGNNGGILAMIAGRKRNFVHSDVRNGIFEWLVPIHVCEWVGIGSIRLWQAKDESNACNGNTCFRKLAERFEKYRKIIYLRLDGEHGQVCPCV
jgi:hypothetical protein